MPRFEPAFTAEQRRRLMEWTAFKVHDEIPDGGAGGVLGAIDRWSPLLRRMCEGGPLTQRDLADLRAVASHWRDATAGEETSGLVADRALAGADLEIAEGIIAAIDATEGHPIDDEAPTSDYEWDRLGELLFTLEVVAPKVEASSEWGAAVKAFEERLRHSVERHGSGADGGVAIAGTSEDEVLCEPEEERAAIVAYTGLWQLREIDVTRETAVLRAARLELRRRLDASEADKEGSDA